MNIAIFLWIIISLLFLLFICAYYSYGFSESLNFFLFAFFYLFATGLPGVNFLYFNIDNKPLNFLSTLAHSLLGLILFYISWVIADKVIGHFSRLREKIFPLVLTAGVVCACFVYAIGITAMGMKWWAAGSMSLFYVTKEWFFFSIYFLVAFSLLVHSRFKNDDWSAVFFLIPIIPIWIIHLFKSRAPYFVMQWVSLMILVVLSVLTNLRLERCRVVIRKGFLSNKLMNLVPIFVVIFGLTTLGMINVVVIRQAKLLLSLFPAVIWAIFYVIKIHSPR